MQATCAHCGATNPAGKIFCVACGKALSAPAPAGRPVGAGLAPPAPPQAPRTAPPQAPAPPPSVYSAPRPTYAPPPAAPTAPPPPMPAPALVAAPAPAAPAARPVYCAACGQPLTPGSAFCNYCGTRLGGALAPPASAGPPRVTQWEYRDFVYEFPPNGMWARVGGDAYTEAGAKLEFWQNSQRVIATELQKWIDDGWEPIGNVDSGCIEIRVSRSHRDKSCLYWTVMGLFAIPSFGLLLLVALFMASTIAEPVRFVVQMRRPVAGP